MMPNIFVLCFCVIFGQLNASAIPMWEYLSKQEKMSFLYSMFANQVESFCESSTLRNCNHQFLKYGLNQLRSLPEEYLDSMDPYQRGANNIIWEALMRGHPNAKTTPKLRETTTGKPNSYEDESFGDLGFGSQSAASAKIDNEYRVLPPKGFIQKYQSRNQYNYYPNHNIRNYLGAFNEKKGVFTRFQNQHTTTTEKVPVESYVEVPLTGPMVVRVYPDGTPVKDNRPVPQDEDLRLYRLSKIQIPNL